MALSRRSASDAAEGIGSLVGAPGMRTGVMVAAGVSLVGVVGGFFLFRAIKRMILASRIKKHRAEIEAVNKLHEKYFARIVVPGYEVKNLPVIFKMVPELTSDIAESLHLTEEVIKSIGSTEPLGNDPALSRYTECILNAINELKVYYFSRIKNKSGSSLEKIKGDVTSNVISYLLYMLDNHCLHFEGYDYDIAYLDAIANFINGFASLEKDIKSPNFSNMSDAFESLLKAKKTLIRHKESLSLGDTISEIKTTCASSSKNLLRSFTKMLVEQKYWSNIEMIDIDELAIGRIQKPFVTNKTWIFVLRNKEVFIHESILKNWVMSLSQYYLKVAEANAKLTDKDLQSPDQLFQPPSFNELSKLRSFKKIFDLQAQGELIKAEENLRDIRRIFKKSHNFITTKIDESKQSDNPIFVPVDDEKELIARVVVLANFATLIHYIISLQYLCINLLTSIKQLGEVYVNDPNNFCKIFVVLDELSKHVKMQIKKSEEAFYVIDDANKNTMQLDDVQEFQNQIMNQLQVTFTKMTTLEDRVRKHKETAAKNPHFLDDKKRDVTQGIYKVADLLADIYKLKTTSSKTTALVDHAVKDTDPQPRVITKMHLFQPPKKMAANLDNSKNKLAVTTANHPLL